MRVAFALLRHRTRVKLVDGNMRECVATDLVTAFTEHADLIAVDHPPMRIAMTASAAGDVEGAARSGPFQDGCAIGVRRVGNVIEGETDQRPAATQRERLRTMMARRLAQNAVQERLKHQCLKKRRRPRANRFDGRAGDANPS